jgi:glycosyltransferase involved in cell wall biosynthesis
MQLSTFAITDSDFVAKDLFDYYSGKNIKEGTIFKIHGKIATHKAPPSSVPFGSKIDIHQEKNRIHDPTELIHYLQEKKKLRSVTHANLMLKEKTWLISVNSIDIRKNIITQIHALKPLWESKQLTLPLVLIGRICFGVSDMLYLIEKDPILSKYVIIFNSLSDNLCWSLWEKAQVCLFTSWYEGFGLPVSESLQLGCPVIASCSTAIPEVAGNLIDYIEPWDTKALQEKVLLYCDPHSEHRKKRLKQLKKFKPTTWDETIEAIIKKI